MTLSHSLHAGSASDTVELMRERYANPLSTLGEISRALIQAAPGKELFIADFSGVESRGAATYLPAYALGALSPAGGGPALPSGYVTFALPKK